MPFKTQKSDFGIVVPIGPGNRPWLVQTLRSLAIQTPTVQIAICGGTDSQNLRDTLEPFQDLIVYRRFGPDAGQSAAINEGWKALDADFYGWLNDDDILHPNALDVTQRMFSDQACDVVTGRTTLIEDQHYRMGYGGLRNPSKIHIENSIAQPSTFVRKAALVELDTHLHYAMDWDLWHRLMTNGAIFTSIPNTLSATRLYKSTKTASFSRKKYQEYYRILKRGSTFPRRLWTLFNIFLNNQAFYGKFGVFFRPIKNLLQRKNTTHQTPEKLAVFHFFDSPIQVEIPGKTRVLELHPGHVIDLESRVVETSR